MNKALILLVAFFATAQVQGQEYKTFKKLNDSTFVETRSYEVDEAAQLDKEKVLAELFREMDRWANVKNRHFNNTFAAQRVFGALNRDQRDLVPDTNYIEYNRFRDTIYSNPELIRDDNNQILYNSRLTIADSAYGVQLFRNAAGAQVLRISETMSNHSARFVQSDKVIRIGGNEPLPGLSSFCDLSFIRETKNVRVYYGLYDNKVVRLFIRKRYID